VGRGLFAHPLHLESLKKVYKLSIEALNQHFEIHIATRGIPSGDKQGLDPSSTEERKGASILKSVISISTHRSKSSSLNPSYLREFTIIHYNFIISCNISNRQKIIQFAFSSFPNQLFSIQSMFHHDPLTSILFSQMAALPPSDPRSRYPISAVQIFHDGQAKCECHNFKCDSSIERNNNG
jgi:hypothetical protein